MNGKDYYSKNAMNSTFGSFFGTISLYISGFISLLLLISVFFSYKSSGFGFLTIFCSVGVLIITASMIKNGIDLKKYADDRTDKCIKIHHR